MRPLDAQRAPGPLDSRWFRRSQLSGARARLFCLPYAGGSARLYRNWHDWLAPEIEVVAVELPGRGVHLRAQPLDELHVLVERLADAAEPLLDRPYALLGHSLGALIAFELARTAPRRGLTAPLHLFVSALRPPHLPAPGPQLHRLSDAELLAVLRRHGALEPEVAGHPEMLPVMLPLLRADFRLAETYTFDAQAPLAHPITAFGGLQDEGVPSRELRAWQEHTRAACVVRLLPGDHFFIHECEHLMAASIAASLTESWDAEGAAPRAGSDAPAVCAPGPSVLEWRP